MISPELRGRTRVGQGAAPADLISRGGGGGGGGGGVVSLPGDTRCALPRNAASLTIVHRSEERGGTAATPNPSPDASHIETASIASSRRSAAGPAPSCTASRRHAASCPRPHVRPDLGTVQSRGASSGTDEPAGHHDSCARAGSDPARQQLLRRAAPGMTRRLISGWRASRRRHDPPVTGRCESKRTEGVARDRGRTNGFGIRADPASTADVRRQAQPASATTNIGHLPGCRPRRRTLLPPYRQRARPRPSVVQSARGRNSS